MIWGLSYLDFGILMGFLAVILAIGIYASRSVQGQHDFYLGGRKMGKTLQFFLNFGNATDTNAAPTMASQVYSKGVSGMWLQLQTLFFTPFFWFTQPWYRRARVTTMADLFMDRFDSKSVAMAYAVFNVIVALLTLGLGNYAAYSVVDAMMAGAIPKWAFYTGYNLIVAIYIMLGGIKAAAITDAIQGILILIMSVILLPMGLWQIGGFSGLHAKVPETSFWLAGTPFSDFTWYSIAAVTFGSFIQIMGLQHNMGSGGSAKDENTARFGMIVGGFTKRLVLICWMLCGLLGVAILQGALKLDRPDKAWGALSLHLLPPGLIGLMLSGMLLGHMPAVGLTAVSVSGLVVRNIYEPLMQGMGLSQKHFLRVGQLIIVLVLGASVGIAYTATSLGSLTTIMITFNTFFGAVVFLLFFWRRLTVPAILASFFVWIFLQAIVSPAVSFTPALCRLDGLTLQTVPYTRTLTLPATADDVAANKAKNLGDLIPKELPVAPTPLFFDKVAPIPPKDGTVVATMPDGKVVAYETNQGKFQGSGHFIVENAILYYPLRAIGLDMRQFSSAGLTTARWLFDGLFPFACLILISLVTRPSAPERAPRFYAKMKTRIAATPELDQVEVEKSTADPTRFDNQKLFPKTNWEFAKWTREDYLGFFGCYAIVVAILGILWLVLHVGKPGPWF